MTLAAVAGGGIWWSRIQRRRAAAPVATPAMEPEQRRLEDRARQHPREVDAQRDLGFYLLEHRRPYEAMWALQDTLDLRPADADARMGLARALVMARLPRQALALTPRPPLPTLGEGEPSQFSRSGSPSPSIGRGGRGVRASLESGGGVDGGRVAAAAYLAMADAADAAAVLRALGPSVRTSAPALYDLGSAYEALGSDAEAATVYRQYTRRVPESAAGELALARAEARRQHWDEATAALARARRLAPDDPRPDFQLGLLLLARGGPKADREGPGSAIDCFRGVLQSHPRFGPAHYQVGLWKQRHGHAREAVASLTAAIAVGAGGDEAHLHLAAALEAAGQKADAAYQRGVYFLQTQQPGRAVQEFRRLAALNPTRPDAPLMVSTASIQMKENGRAAEAARQGLEQHPDDPALLARRGMLLLMLHNYAGASRLCRDWMARYPNAAEPYSLLGRIAREELHPEEAVRLCEQAMARDPQNAEYCVEAARALAAVPTPDHLRRAAALLGQAIAINRQDSQAHLQLGNVLQRLGDREGARRQFQQCAADDPTSWEAIFALTQLCPRLGKGDRSGFYAAIVRELQEREDAAELLWRRVFHQPDDAEAHARLARLLREAGDLPQARRQLEQAVTLRSDGAQSRQLAIIERILALRGQ